MKIKFPFLFTNPASLFHPIRTDNLSRLLFYLMPRRFFLMFDLLKHPDKLRPANHPKEALYSVNNIPDNLNFRQYENPLVSIIIPVLNHWETTLSCLISIFENSGNVPYEVIVADDGSSDETLNLASYASNIKIIANKTNLGFLMNCNNAVRHATGCYLIFLNNDTIVQPYWLKPLVDLMERDNRVGIAGSKLVYPDGRLQEAGGIIWQDGTGFNYGRLDFPDRPEYNYLKEVDYISGASIMVRKSLWLEIGGFDKRFLPAYYEDTDLAFEIRKHGYKVVYQPLSMVVHLEGRTHGRDVNGGLKAYQVSNQAKFFTKWQKTLVSEHFNGTDKIFKVRDRSAKKKTVLFIDRHVPFFDQDAGSKSTIQYLQLMVEMGYNIKFLGDDFINHEPYTSDLQQMGIEVLYGQWYKYDWKEWIVKNGKYIDYVYLCRPHIAQKYLGFIKKHTSSKLIYCGHDLNYLRELRRYMVEGNKSFLDASKKIEKVELDIVHKVDVSYFFSDFESIELIKRVPDYTIRTIPIFLFDEREIDRKASSDFESSAGILFVGGFDHAPNIDAVQWFVKDIFPLIKIKIPDIEFIVAGTRPPPEIVRLSGNGVVITGRLSDEELQLQYQMRRLVVAPLRYGAGVKGKIIEAMSYGVPTVTTHIGAEGIIDANKALFIADEPQGFADMVTRAYNNSDLWNNTAKKLPSIIKRYFSKDAAREILALDMPLD